MLDTGITLDNLTKSRMVRVIQMAPKTQRSTYSLDTESACALEALAQLWKVSKSEALQRAIQVATRPPAIESGAAALAALDQLQASLSLRKVDLAKWERDLNAQRGDASARCLAR